MKDVAVEIALSRVRTEVLDRSWTSGKEVIGSEGSNGNLNSLLFWEELAVDIAHRCMDYADIGDTLG